MRRRICAATAGLFLALGALLFAGTRQVPSDQTLDENDFLRTVRPPAPVRDILVRSCFACHSGDTRLPFYARLPIIGGFVKSHAAAGRARMDFSSWSENARKDPETEVALLAGICETTTMQTMPLPSYLAIHWNARLSPADVLPCLAG